MKIPFAKIASFVKAPDEGVNYILVYGPDAGLVAQNTRTICKTVVDDLNDPFLVADLSFDKLKEEPAILADEINAISMIGGRRLVLVRTSSTSLPKDFVQILESYSGDTMVVFSAGDLSTTSSLRKFFEKTDNAAAVPCYKDDNSSIERVIANKLKEYNITYDNGVIQHLIASFSGDRMVILSETEKLITYMGKEKHITLADAQVAIFDSSEFSLDDLCTAFASRNPRDTDIHMNRALADGVASIIVIRTILRYFMRLQDVKNKMDSGATEQQAMASLRPPVFFKQAPIFKRHLNMWKSSDINRVIKQFIELEIACKTTGNPADLLCARLLTVLPLIIK